MVFYSHQQAPSSEWRRTGANFASFDSYGPAPGAIQHQGLVLGPACFGSKRSPMYPGPTATGGLAVFRIRLSPMQGASTTAVLQVNCALGNVPRERSVEGIRVKIGGKQQRVF